MDYNKIGQFIMKERKRKKLTQLKLAERLFVSEKTISKWENGKGIPDTASLQKLSETLGVSINELLNGERIANEDYAKKAEEKLIELEMGKEQADKRLLSMEIVIGVLSVLILLSFTLFAKFVELPLWAQIVLIVGGVLIAVVGFIFALKIEQVAGYYECRKCGHKYIPTYGQVFCAMHIKRTRYMKCPHCHKRSWCKKVVK